MAVLPVRLCIGGNKDSHLVHTLDVSNDGVRLGGFRGEVKVGDKILGIQICWEERRSLGKESPCVHPTVSAPSGKALYTTLGTPADKYFLWPG